MSKFNDCTAKEFWNLGTQQRLKLLQAVYKGTMDYLADDEYESLPCGVKQRFETFLKIMENKRNGK